MLRAVPGQEIETKLRVTDLSALRTRLRHLRAKLISPRTHESNTLYDTPKRDLTRHGQMIRIRVEQLDGKGKSAGPRHDAPGILTFKGPAKKLRISKRQTAQLRIINPLKVREEHEVAFDSWQRMANILLALGLTPAFRYEKFRTTYTLPGVQSLKVELDETPVGIFLELEGTAAAIDRAASLLGYARRDFINETYGALYLDDCRRRRVKPSDMLFRRTKKTR
jgi:adenylate cyclase, class 2